MLSADKHAETYAGLLATLGFQYSKGSSAFSSDRRRHVRHHMGRNCTYHAVSQSGFGQAMLRDISQTGLSISCPEKIDVEQPLSILVESAESSLLSWTIRATVVRDTEIALGDLYQYGCRIKSIVNPDLEQLPELLIPRDELWEM